MYSMWKIELGILSSSSSQLCKLKLVKLLGQFAFFNRYCFKVN